MFDRIISIDWSGADEEAERVDLRVAVWEKMGTCALQRPPGKEKVRSWTRDECKAWLSAELSKPGRTLVAMDFGFGLPWGSDKVIFGVTGWRHMVEKIAEVYRNHGTARTAASAINKRWDGHGPYRFDDSRADFEFCLRQGISYYRLTELAAPQAISQWYLGSGGTVGFHTITGLSAINHWMKQRDDGIIKFQVWPHETLEPKGNVLVEVYPSLFPKPNDWGSCKDGNEKDAWKVLTHLVNANAAGNIDSWFALPSLRFGRVDGVHFADQIAFEGFIFGLR